jgi:hypothetical protein
MGICPEVMDVDRSEGDMIGDGGNSSRRAMREGDDGGGRGADWLSFVTIVAVVCSATKYRRHLGGKREGISEWRLG